MGFVILVKSFAVGGEKASVSAGLQTVNLSAL
jgi:hypothetical protein